MRSLSFVLLFLLIATAHASPVARIVEEADMVYLDGAQTDLTSQGYVDVFVPSGDILQYVRVNVSSTTNTNLVSKETWHAVAASPNDARTRLFVNTSSKMTMYNVSASAIPSIELDLDYANAAGGTDIVPGTNTVRFSLYLNSSTSLSTNLLIQVRSSGTDILNITAPLALASDSDSDGYNDQLSWSGTLTSTRTLVQFNATLIGDTNFNISLKQADIDDGYGILANHTQSTTFSGLSIASTFSRGPVRQGVDLELFDVWKARGFIRNTAQDVNYTINTWSLYEVDSMAEVSSGTLDQVITPNDLVYTDWYDTGSASKAYYASAFNWEVDWDTSEALGILSSQANLPTMYMTDLWTQKTVAIGENTAHTRTLTVEDIVRNTGHADVNLSSITITSVIPASTIGGSRRTLTVSNAKVYLVSNGTTELSVTPTITNPSSTTAGSVVTTVSTSDIGRPLAQNEDIKLTYTLTGSPAPVAYRFRFSGSAQVSTVSGTSHSESFASADLDVSEISSSSPAGGGGAIEIVAPPTTVAIAKDLTDAETLLSLGQDEEAADEFKSIINDQIATIDQVMTHKIIAEELDALDLKELGLSLENTEAGEALLAEATEKLEEAEKEKSLDKQLELIKEALELQQAAQERLPEVSTVSEVVEVTGADYLSAEQALGSATSVAAQQEIRNARDRTSFTADSIELSRTSKVYAVTNAEKSTKTVHRTKATIIIKAANDVWGIQVIEVIPKTAAESTDEITFEGSPRVLQKDPIVAWSFDEMKRDETKVVSYVLKDKYDDLIEQSTSLASIDKTRIDDEEIEALSIAEEVLFQGLAKVSQPVFWSKTLSVTNPNPTPYEQTFRVLVPTDMVTAEINEGEIKPKDVFKDDQRFIEWTDEVEPGEFEYRILLSTPPVVEAERSIDVLSSSANQATLATHITLENLAQEAYLNLEYDYPIQYDKVLSIDMVEPLRYRRNDGQITILIPALEALETSKLTIQNTETPPVLEIGINKAKSRTDSILDMTTLVVASETTASPHLEVEIVGAENDDLVYADLIPLTTLESGGRLVLEDSIDLASLPTGDYSVSVLFRKDMRTIQSRTEGFSVGGAPLGIQFLPFLALALFVFLVVSGIKYTVNTHGDTLHRLMHGVEVKTPVRSIGPTCSTCGKRLKFQDIYRCARCGKVLCEEHRNIYHNQEYCEECLYDIKPKTKKASKTEKPKKAK